MQTRIYYNVAVIDAGKEDTLAKNNRQRISPLRSSKITMESLPEISRILHRYSSSRTCDYTVGGIFMWVDFFDYRFCIYGNTLFICGDLENRPGVKAFSLPVGEMPIENAINLLREYCSENGMKLRFSAIPEDRLSDFRCFGLKDTEELTEWADYLYEAESLARLAGKKLSKKRNHFNRFIADNPGYSVSDIRDCDRKELKAAYTSWTDISDLTSPSAVEEHNQVYTILENPDAYPFEGIVLRDGKGRIAAFTVGEVIGDTLYVHIEKIDKETAGAGETVSKLFADRIVTEHPETIYINREEDTGDEGLRQSKLSYHPVMLLRKYNILL